MITLACNKILLSFRGAWVCLCGWGKLFYQIKLWNETTCLSFGSAVCERMCTVLYVMGLMFVDHKVYLRSFMLQHGWKL